LQDDMSVIRLAGGGGNRVGWRSAEEPFGSFPFGQL
jgi:hypothetical protein